MKRKVGNIIAILFISGMITYVVIGSIIFNNRKENILRNGNFSSSIINDEFIGRQSVRSFTYEFIIGGKTYINEFDVNQEYFNKHQIGDTIVIKFLPSKPEKSIIIEDKEYKSCMGLPPKVGWKKLPVCK